MEVERVRTTAFGVKAAGAIVVHGSVDAIDAFFRDAQRRHDLAVIYLKTSVGGKLRIVTEPGP